MDRWTGGWVNWQTDGEGRKRGRVRMNDNYAQAERCRTQLMRYRMQITAKTKFAMSKKAQGWRNKRNVRVKGGSSELGNELHQTESVAFRHEHNEPNAMGVHHRIRKRRRTPGWDDGEGNTAGHPAGMHVRNAR